MEIITANIPSELKIEIDTFTNVNFNRSNLVTNALRLWLKERKKLGEKVQAIPLS